VGVGELGLWAIILEWTCCNQRPTPHLISWFAVAVSDTSLLND